MILRLHPPMFTDCDRSGARERCEEILRATMTTWAREYVCAGCEKAGDV